MNRLWGYISVIVATLFFGIWNTFSKILLNDLDPVVISTIVYCMAGIFLFLIHISPLNKPIITKLKSPSKLEDFINTKDYLILILASIIGTVLAPIIFLNGLKQTTAVNASLLMNVEILFIIIIGIIFLKERLQLKDSFAFLFIIIGTVFLTTNGNFSSFQQDWGSILIICSAFLWSIDNTLNKFLSYKQDIIYITALKCSIGGVILLLLSFIWNLNFYIPPNNWPYLFFIGIFSAGVTFILIYYSMRVIGATRTGSLYSLATLFGAIFAFLILKEPFNLMQLMFGVLMLIGVYIFYMNSK